MPERDEETREDTLKETIADITVILLPMIGRFCSVSHSLTRFPSDE